MVPDAGARSGMPDGVETTIRTLAVQDLESGQTLSPSSSFLGASNSPSQSTEAL